MRVAAVDIGTNTARLLIADWDGRELHEVVRVLEVTALGRGVDADGRLDPVAIDRTVNALGAFGDHIREHGVQRSRAIATSASRDAANRDMFFDAAETALGFRPELISGEVEASLAFRGAAGAARRPDTALVVDIGGGSTEFVTAAGGRSVDIGSIRLTDRHLLERPVTPATLSLAKTVADAAISDLPVPDDIDEVIGVAGTWTSISAIVQNLAAYDRSAVHLSTVSRTDVSALMVDLADRSLEDTASIPSLDPARAPVILGGTVVARACMDRLGIDDIVVSELDILDGVGLDLASGAA